MPTVLQLSVYSFNVHYLIYLFACTGHNTGQFRVRLPYCKFANLGGAQVHKKIESGYRTERTVFLSIWALQHVRQKRLYKGRLTYHATEM